MSSICIIDTSVFLNFLDVPNCNQDRESILNDYQVYAEDGCQFVLPMATILETGNHIAQNGNGQIRRKKAEGFVKEVKAALTGESPWQLSELPNHEDILNWIDQFPDYAGRNKSADRQEGTSFAEMTIIEEFNKICHKCSMSTVFIWSLDQDLKSYHKSQQNSSNFSHNQGLKTDDKNRKTLINQKTKSRKKRKNNKK